MIVEQPINWLSKAQFQPEKLGNPITLMVTGYAEEKGTKGVNRRITGLHINGTEYTFDVYGDVIATLLKDLGNDSDKWNGRYIRVMLVQKGDKDIKKVTVMPSDYTEVRK